jgi:hypothetical protein
MCDGQTDNYTNRLNASITIRPNNPNSKQNERLIRIASLAPNAQVITDEARYKQGIDSSSMQNIASNNTCASYVQANTIEKREWSSVDNVICSNHVEMATTATELSTAPRQNNYNCNNNHGNRDNSYFEKFNRYSKSQSPNPNSLYRKNDVATISQKFPSRFQMNGMPHERSQTPPRIKLNISLAPNMKLRESDFIDKATQRASSCMDERPVDQTTRNLHASRHSVGRGVSPFTYIETTSIKQKTNGLNRSQDIRPDRSIPPPRKETHKTLFMTKLSPKQSRKNLQQVHIPCCLSFLLKSNEINIFLPSTCFLYIWFFFKVF